jgi:hypothetical protein
VLSGAILDPATKECYITRVSHHRSWADGVRERQERRPRALKESSTQRLKVRTTTFSVCKLEINSWGNL